MYTQHPQHTELGRARDPLIEMRQEHRDLCRWMGYLDEALADMGRPDGWVRLRIVELFLCESLPRHFAFEELSVFPALLEREPDTGLALVLSELVADHRQIMAEIKAFSAMTSGYDCPPPPPRRPAIRGQGEALRDALLRHAELEDEVLMPVIRQAPMPEPEPLELDALSW